MSPDERDPHLRQALRHAPDAQAEAPPALSAAILKEARAKAHEGAPPRRPPASRFWAAWDALARPSVAAGLASVLVATVVGLMWWDEPMDEALPRRPDAVASPAAPSAQDAAIERSVPAAAEPAPAIADPSPPPHARKEAPRPRPAPSRERERAAPTADALEQRAAESAAPMQAAPRAADTPPPPASPPAASLEAMPPAPPPSRLRDGATERPALAARAQGAAASSAAAITSLRNEIAAQPARWTWQRGTAGDVHPLHAPLQIWLGELDSASGAAWRTRPAAEPATARSLRLLRDGEPVHVFYPTATGWAWETGPFTRSARLPADASGALAASLDLAAP